MVLTAAPETRWLNDAEQLAWRRLAAVLLTLPASMDAELQRDAGLTLFDYLVLSTLSEEPGQVLRMGVIASRTSSSLSRLSHVVSKLESRGWLTRSPLTGNRRVTMVTLTESGLAKVTETAPAHVDHVRHIVFDVLNDAQVEQLSAIGVALLSKLDPDYQIPQTR